MRSPPASPPDGAVWAHALAAALRRRGVAVPTSALLDFVEAAAVVGVERRGPLYWAGRATLVRRAADGNAYDDAFAEVVDGAGVAAPAPPDTAAPAPAPSVGGAAAVQAPAAPAFAEAPAGPCELGPDGGDGVAASSHERLARADLAALTDAEREQALRLVDEMRASTPRRSSRRRRPAARSGRIDLGATLARAVTTGGEPVVLATTRRTERPRRVVLLADVSGSMRPYATAVLRLLHATVAAGGPVEAFALGTRLTRLTPHLRHRDPDLATAAAASAVADWAGGTRLGDGLARFNDEWARRGVARGAVVVVVSDGWDTGDPARLGTEMARLRLLAHHVVWANPLAAGAGYEPTARGMAAALPHVDLFVPAHSVETLTGIVTAMAAGR